MATEDEDVVIDLELRDYLSAGAKVAAEEIDDMADNTRQLNRELLLLNRRAKKAAASVLQLAAAVRTFNGVQGASITNFNNLNNQIGKYTKGNRQLTKSMVLLNRHSRRSNRNLSLTSRHLKMVARVAPMAAMGLMAVAAAMAVMGLGAAGGIALQGLLQIAGALASLVSFSALLPTILGSVIATAITLAVAFKGVGAALSAIFSEDPAELEEALKKLSPAAAEFIKQIVPFKKHLQEIKKLVQDALFKPLVKEIGPFLKTLLPVVQTWMVGLSRSLGELLRDFMTFLRSTEGVRMIDALFSSAMTSVKMLKDSLKPLMEGFSDLIVGIRRPWDRFMVAIGSGITRFGAWLSAISSDGRLQRWLDLGFRTASQLFQMLVLVGSILTNIVSAAGGADGGAMSAVVEFLRTINEWASSMEGQSTIAAFFMAMKASLQAMTPILGVVASFIGDVLMPSIAEIVKGLGPGLTVFLQALSDGFARLLPYWGPFAKAIGDVLVALSPLLAPLAELVGVIGMGLAQAFEILAGVLGPFIQAISGPLTTVFQLFAQQMVKEMPLIAEMVKKFADSLVELSPIMIRVADIFTQQFSEFLRQHAELLAKNLPLIMELAVAFGQNLMQAIEVLLPYLPDLLKAFFELALTMMQLGPTLLPLVLQFFKEVVPMIIPLLPLILQLAIFGLKMAAALISAGLAIISFFVSVGTKIDDTVTKIKDIVGKVYDFLTTPFRLAKDAILGWISDITAGMGGALGKIGEIAKKIQDIDINPFRALGGDVEAGVKYTVGEIGPEMFVPNVGNPSMIGQHGMETRSFPTSGMVVPSFMLDAFKRVEKGIDRQFSHMESDSTSSAELTAAVAAGVRAAGESGGDTYNLNLNFNGDVSKEVDIERAVKKAIKKINDDKKERS